MRAAGVYRQSVEPELRVSKLFALNVATQVVKALADAGLLSLPERDAEAPDGSLRSGASGTPVDPDVLTVLRYVSAGRGYVDVEPYPDAAARRVLGAIDTAAEEE
jgi:hypothetical protein